MSEAGSGYTAVHQATLAMTLANTGFDNAEPLTEGWLRGTSLSSPLVVYVRWQGGPILLAIRDLTILTPVMQAIGLQPVSFVTIQSKPPGVAEVGTIRGETTLDLPAAQVADLPQLHEALAAAFLASRGSGLLEPLDAFTIATAKLPKQTEAERWVVQRVGQDLFREALLQRWQGRCPLSGIDVPDLLRASHIKPWADCATDAERLDPDNGLLLAVQWDAAFDKGFVSFDDSGRVIWSSEMHTTLRDACGLRERGVIAVTPAMAGYLNWHREHVLRI